MYVILYSVIYHDTSAPVLSGRGRPGQMYVPSSGSVGVV